MPELTRDEVVDHIKTSLGYPIVAVELDDVHFDHAIEHSLLLFNRYLGELQLLAFYGCDDSWTHTFEVTDYVKGITNIKVLFPQDLSAYTSLNVFEIMYRMLYPRMPVGEWYLLKGIYKQYLRVRGGDPDWHYDNFSRTLYVDCHSGPWDILVEVTKDLTMDSINTGLRSYQDLFLQVCEAEAKLMLAKVRGKFSGGIPAPGGAMQTDAQQLYQEAQQTLQQAQETLNAEARFSNPVVIGG